MAKYIQPIHAVITRIYDVENNKYHFLRNDTKIIFGNGGKLLGTVFMSNPGSFEFKYDPNWQLFKNGGGASDVFKSTEGRPDPTMINIIKAIETAYAEKGKDIPAGYVRIYNLSSVRCPNGKDALGEHNRIKEILINNGEDIRLLEDPMVYDDTCFKNTCDQSAFVMMGFLKEFLTSEAERLIACIDNYSKNKKITAHSNTKQYPYHPIVWIKLNQGKPFNDVVKALQKVI